MARTVALARHYSRRQASPDPGSPSRRVLRSGISGPQTVARPGLCLYPARTGACARLGPCVCARPLPAQARPGPSV